ncbi:MAG: hypothetical protein F2857_00625 [Actinobacteria bacterium]|jgi:hypothetical protein|nr:hypothetical protein [Actinomycetota bacterium]MSW48996.1 hypothetical protein [Actinomycetota bacterium]
MFRPTPTWRRVLKIAALVCASSLTMTGCGVINYLTNRSNVVDGVGRIPGGDFSSLVTLPDGVSIDFPELLGPMMGPQVGGPRVLMIGDSIMASTSSRYGNEMCDTLVQLGWQVEVEAQSGSFVDFGLKVLDERLDAGWDTAVVFLGTNYDGNQANYENKMRQIFEKLSPMPFVVLTTGMFNPRQQKVNDVIMKLASDFSNVTVLDWGTISTNNGILGKDRIHLSADGRSVFAAAIARALEFAPTREGECLPMFFKSDAPVPGVMPAETVPVTTDSSTPDAGVLPDTSTTLP